MDTDDDLANDPVWVAIQSAPLAPEEDRLTPEQNAELDEILAFSKAHPGFTFTSDEIAVGLVYRRALDTDDGEPPDAAAAWSIRDLTQRAERLCQAEGVSLSEMAARVAAKSAAAEEAWKAWKARPTTDAFRVGIDRAQGPDALAASVVAVDGAAVKLIR